MVVESVNVKYTRGLGLHIVTSLPEQEISQSWFCARGSLS